MSNTSLHAARLFAACITLKLSFSCVGNSRDPHSYSAPAVPQPAACWQQRRRRKEEEGLGRGEEDEEDEEDDKEEEIAEDMDEERGDHDAVLERCGGR